MITNIDPKIQISDEYRNSPEVEENVELLEIEQDLEDIEVKSYQNTLFLISGSRVREEESSSLPISQSLSAKSMSQTSFLTSHFFVTFNWRSSN